MPLEGFGALEQLAGESVQLPPLGCPPLESGDEVLQHFAGTHLGEEVRQPLVGDRAKWLRTVFLRTGGGGAAFSAGIHLEGRILGLQDQVAEVPAVLGGLLAGGGGGEQAGDGFAAVQRHGGRGRGGGLRAVRTSWLDLSATGPSMGWRVEFPRAPIIPTDANGARPVKNLCPGGPSSIKIVLRPLAGMPPTPSHPPGFIRTWTSSSVPKGARLCNGYLYRNFSPSRSWA